MRQSSGGGEALLNKSCADAKDVLAHPVETTLKTCTHQEFHPIKITVSSLSGDSFSLQLNPLMTLENLKEEIQEQTGEHPQSQRLLLSTGEFVAEELIDRLLLCHLVIVHLFLRRQTLRGCGRGVANILGHVYSASRVGNEIARGDTCFSLGS